MRSRHSQGACEGIPYRPSLPPTLAVGRERTCDASSSAQPGSAVSVRRRPLAFSGREAPRLEQSDPLGGRSGEVVLLPLRVDLHRSHNVSVAPVLSTQSASLVNYSIRRLSCVSRVLLRFCTRQWKLNASSSSILPSLEGTQSGGSGCGVSAPGVTPPNTNSALMANQPPNLGCTHTPNIFCRGEEMMIENLYIYHTLFFKPIGITFPAQGCSVTSDCW